MRPRTGAFVVAVSVAVLGIAVAAIPPASAATKPPGLLRTQDLPGKFQLVTPPYASTSASLPLVDAATCTQTLKAVAGVTLVTFESFGRVGALVSSVAVYETVLSFSSAKAAKTGFTAMSQNDAAAVKCGKVGFIPPNGTTVVSTIDVRRVKFPKFGNATFAQTNGAVPRSVSIWILSGSHVAVLGAQSAEAPTTKDLKTIAGRVVKRLPHSTTITTTTTTFVPLKVDPVTSRCAEDGRIASPSSAQAATITFVNRTGQSLRIFWLDSTGARRSYGEVAAGASSSQGTFVGHFWLLADQTDRCLRIATADAAGTSVTVSA